jgi:hypothetical protein
LISLTNQILEEAEQTTEKIPLHLSEKFTSERSGRDRAEVLISHTVNEV